VQYKQILSMNKLQLI